MIPRQLLQALNLKDNKDIKMAENLWKMLDQMADTNPQDYQNFISKNLKQGVADIKQQKQKRQQPLKVLPKVGLLLEADATLSELGQTKQNDKFKINDNIEPWEKVKLKFQPKIKINLNVCHSDRVILPLDKNNNQISQLSTASISRIASIPYSLQSPKQQQDGKLISFLLVLNDQVFQGLKNINPPYLINMASCLLQQRLKSDKNPLFQKYNPKNYPDKLAFYQIKKQSIKLNKQINFKFGDQSNPPKVLLEVGSDRQQSKDVNKSKTQQKQIMFKSTQQKEEIKLPQIRFQTSSQTKDKPKKALIEEISQNNEDDTRISYTIVKGETDYKLQFLVPGVSSIKQLQLDVNSRCIRVNIPTLKKHRQVDLQRNVDLDAVKAKLIKKEGKLSVVLPFNF